MNNIDKFHNLTPPYHPVYYQVQGFMPQICPQRPPIPNCWLNGMSSRVVSNPVSLACSPITSRRASIINQEELEKEEQDKESNDVRLVSFQDRLGYIFKNLSFLQLALMHQPYKGNVIRNPLLEINQRLEFLGDAAISVYFAEYLYNNYLHTFDNTAAQEKRYSTIFGLLTANINCMDYMKKLDPPYDSRNELVEKNLIGKRSDKKSLADLFEALSGAIYLDGSYYDLQKVLNLQFTGTFAELTKTIDEGIVKRDKNHKLAIDSQHQSHHRLQNPAIVQFARSLVRMSLTEWMFTNYPFYPTSWMHEVREAFYDHKSLVECFSVINKGHQCLLSPDSLSCTELENVLFDYVARTYLMDVSERPVERVCQFFITNFQDHFKQLANSIKGIEVDPSFISEIDGFRGYDMELLSYGMATHRQEPSYSFRVKPERYSKMKNCYATVCIADNKHQVHFFNDGKTDLNNKAAQRVLLLISNIVPDYMTALENYCLQTNRGFPELSTEIERDSTNKIIKFRFVVYIKSDEIKVIEEGPFRKIMAAVNALSQLLKLDQSVQEPPIQINIATILPPTLLPPSRSTDKIDQPIQNPEETLQPPSPSRQPSPKIKYSEALVYGIESEKKTIAENKVESILTNGVAKKSISKAARLFIKCGISPIRTFTKKTYVADLEFILQVWKNKINFGKEVIKVEYHKELNQWQGVVQISDEEIARWDDKTEVVTKKRVCKLALQKLRHHPNYFFLFLSDRPPFANLRKKDSLNELNYYFRSSQNGTLEYENLGNKRGIVLKIGKDVLAKGENRNSAAWNLLSSLYRQWNALELEDLNAIEAALGNKGTKGI